MTHSTSIETQPAALETDDRSCKASKSRQARRLHEPTKDQAEQPARTHPGRPAAKINAQ